MKKRLILPFVTLGIASAMVAGGLLTQPRAIEAEPGAGGGRAFEVEAGHHGLEH